jgi:YHS domain-containing protein
MPVDPVCGIEMDESLAVTYEYEEKKYFFCCNGCRRIFKKKPKKWKKNA